MPLWVCRRQPQHLLPLPARQILPRQAQVFICMVLRVGILLLASKQWGYTGSTSATYPIALTSAFIALTTTNNGSSKNNYDDRPTFNTKTISTNVGNFYYAVFGK